MDVQTLAGTCDTVAGILKPKALLRELDIEFARSRRYENSFALLRVKITISDHTQTDSALLQRLSGAVRLVVRWSDSVAKESACQYLILLRETNASGARTAADKLVAVIHTELPEDTQKLNFEFNFAAWRKGDHLQALLARLGGS